MDGRRMALAASALVVLVACATSGEGGLGGGAVGEPQAGPDLAEVPSVEGVGAAAIPLPGVRPTVIKTATLRIEVDPTAVPEAMSAATRAAGRYGGFILHSEAVEAGRATLVIRVPSRRYEPALADIRALGDVERSVVDGQDVGEEFVDLEARLRNLQAEQAVMFLRDQTAFGTITVTFVERGVEEGVGIIERSWNQAVDGLVAVAAGAVAVIGYLIPVAVLGLIAGVVLRKMWPRLGVRSP